MQEMPDRIPHDRGMGPLKIGHKRVPYNGIPSCEQI